MIRFFEYIAEHEEAVTTALRAALLLAVILAMYALVFGYVARTAIAWMKAHADFQKSMDDAEQEKAKKERDRLTDMSCQAAIAAEKEVARRG